MIKLNTLFRYNVYIIKGANFSTTDHFMYKDRCMVIYMPQAPAGGVPVVRACIFFSLPALDDDLNLDSTGSL